MQALQFMSIRQRLYYNICIFIFKTVNKMMPEQLNDRLSIVEHRTGRQTKQAGSIVVDFRKTKSAQNVYSLRE